jgi:hypothetical protein
MKGKNPFEFDGYHYYYLRTPDGDPIGCVAFKVGLSSATVIRGISICSATQRWDRKEARSKARKRCIRAELQKSSGECIQNYYRPSVYRFITLCDKLFEASRCSVFTTSGLQIGIPKSAYDVPANALEFRILQGDAAKNATKAIEACIPAIPEAATEAAAAPICPNTAPIQPEPADAPVAAETPDIPA